jgi:hypothetical protein
MSTSSATEPTRLIAFHGDPKIKAKYLARVKAHRKADEIIHGTYWKKGKGCAVGCTIHGSDHGAYETELGIPRVLAHLEDGIFESLPNGRAKDWPVEFLTAIPVGADLSRVWSRFAVWLLGDAEDGVIRFAKTDRTRNAILAVVAAYSLEQTPSAREWRELASAARHADAAAYAAYADAAAYAADAAAYAAYAAAYAYAAAAADAAADAARHQARIKQADKLLELLRAA